jgi:hypothetical protein
MIFPYFKFSREFSGNINKEIVYPIILNIPGLIAKNIKAIAIADAVMTDIVFFSIATKI